MASAQRSQYYEGPPPGQGHFNSYPSSGSSNHRDDRDRYGYDRAPPPRSGSHHDYPPQQQQQPYFDPPPTDAYPSEGEYGAQRGQPFPEYDDRYPDERYAGERAPPGPEDGAALTPYDDEKAEAEWRRGVEEAYARQPPPPPPRQPPPSDYDRRAEAEEREREMEMERQRGMEIERQRQMERDRYYDELERERELDRQYERERRKRRDEEAMKERALRYPSDPKKGGRDFFGSSEGERGVAAELAGGAGGALIAHEVSDSAMGTLGGLVVGALAAKVLERQYENRKQKKEYSRRNREVPYPPPGRDMEDVRRTGRDGARSRRRDSMGPPPDDREGRGRSQRSQSMGFKDRVKRSLSRLRSRSTRRRSPSRDSEDTHYR